MKLNHNHITSNIWQSKNTMMSNETEQQAKRQKTSHKQNFYIKRSRKQFIEPGHRGFLATCNFREKDCVRECYNILNHYADELYGTVAVEGSNEAEEKKESVDISDELERDIQNMKTKASKQNFRFQVVDTGTTNCIFITTTVEDPIELGEKIVSDIATTKIRKTRYLLRLVPISVVCRANLKDIMDSAGPLFDKYFLKEPKSFSIIFNKRYNNDVKRDDIIKELAAMVSQKNSENKVDLGGASVSIIVEVIKGLCCLSVVSNYLKYKKYNLAELASKGSTDKTKPEEVKVDSPEAEDKQKWPERQVKTTDSTNESTEEEK